MSPESIAIVGASNNPTKMGTIQYLQLIHSGFTGEVFPVHPKEKVVFGKKAYANISDLPYAPDLAILVVPTKLIPSMIEDFGKLGTRHAVIISAGFKETGKIGHKLEGEVVEIAKRYGMRFLGPNCLGIINTQLPLNVTVMPVQTYNGKLGLASQSGTYVSQTLPYLYKRGIAFSKAISVGNAANIDIVDCLEYLGQDDATKAICLYIESIKRPDQFLNVAREISRHKPIVAQYVGGTEAGARSGSSHTGAMAGPDYIYDGLFAQAGVIRVRTVEELYAVGWTLATQPPLKGPRIAVLTNSGGPGTAIADTCSRQGLSTPEFSHELQEAVRPFIPGHASPRNPVDLTFHMDMKGMTEHIPEVLFGSDEIDGIIIHGIMDTGFAEIVYPMFKDLVKVSLEEFKKSMEIDLEKLVNMPEKKKKPLLISSFFGIEDNAIRSFHKHGIPTFDSPEKTAYAMSALYKYFLIQKRLHGKPGISPVPDKAKKLIAGIDAKNIDECKAKQILAACGIPVTNEVLVHTYEEACAGAKKIGYPVALKVCSPEILHKTERGLVKLNIQDEDALKRAYDSIQKKEKNTPMLVCEMLKGDRELIAGMSYFPGFPPCILLGIGGIFAEVLKDTTFRLAPLSQADALSMVDGLSSKALLGAYRGMKPVDKNAIASILVKLGDLAMNFPQIKEIDLNPIIIVNGKPKVADALFVMED
jgi:acetyltransferase